MLLMALDGRFGDIPDLAIFADTGWEPKAVYEHLNYLESEVAPFPIERVSAGNIRDDSLASRRFASMPLYIRNQNQTKGQLKRQCTYDYKIAPIYRKLREFLGAGRPAPGAVELWLGISLDEATRMKPSRVKYIRNRWPLIEEALSRLDCVNWLSRNGYPTPPKSACIGCPYHGKANWRRMKRDDPESFADAADFDRRVRNMTRIDAKAYLVPDLVPLAEADFSNEEDAGQMTLDGFDSECEGMCGL